jgi:hypothetical protein
VQYFERAVFERHPEHAGTPFEVLLAQLGTYQYRAKYPAGAPNQQASADNARLFPETGKHLGGKFRAYWEGHGGLAQQGYPVSNSFVEVSDVNGQPYSVQYFERARFEYHPEAAGSPQVVQLTNVGRIITAGRTDPRYDNNSAFPPQPLDHRSAEKTATADDDDAVHERTVETARSARSRSRTHGQNSAKSTVVETAIAIGMPTS